MKQRIAHITLVVKDYDEALHFYTKKLNFIIIEDTVLSDTKRWVLIAPIGATECCILLAKAINKQQTDIIGNQTGGRVFLFLYTDDISRDYNHLLENDVKIIRAPSEETYGTILVFVDLYGNLWDVIQPKYTINNNDNKS